MMKPLILPDYSHSILNVTHSILKHYQVPTRWDSIPLLDKELAKQYRNVVLVLVDGMGSFILNRIPADTNYLLRDKRTDITSVFPSTTVSATTAVLTGKTPVETGWLGWAQYFQEKETSIVLFTNEDFYDEKRVFAPGYCEQQLPIRPIYSLIEESSPDVHTHEIFPAFRVPENNTFGKLLDAVKKATDLPGRNFVYAYWDKLDSQMHETGPSSVEVKEMIETINETYEAFVRQLPDDTLVITIADHGQIDVEPIHLMEFPDIQETFRHKPSLESRCSAFFIKPGMEKIFEERFKTHFRTSHILYKSAEFLKLGFFGPGIPHPRVEEFIGDYVAVAIDNRNFMFDESASPFKGHHAGLTADEMMVPLIIHSPKK